MPESSSSETLSTQQVQQARYRLAPLALNRFVEGVPVREDFQPLSQEQVEEQSFAALGYMEEYFRPPSQTGDEITINGEMNLRELEAQLDASLLSSKRNDSVRRVLAGVTPDEGGEATEETQKLRSEHREKIKQKISDLLSHPQVREKFQPPLT